MEKLEGVLFFIGPGRTSETRGTGEVSWEGTELGAANTRVKVQRASQQVLEI